MADDNAQVEAPEDNAAKDEPRQLTEVEQLAHEMGWNPDFKGENPRTAQDWIKSTDANNRNLKRELKDVKSSVDRIIAASDKQVKREVQARAQEIEARFNEAVENKDTKGAAKAANEMRELEADQTPSGNSDVVAKFQRENAWYGQDADATEYAASVSNRLAREGVTDPETQLSRVRDAVRKRFPEHFQDEPQTRRPPQVNDPGSRSLNTPKAKTVGDMPKVAQDAAERFFENAKMRGSVKEDDKKSFMAQYAKDFFSNQDAA